MNAGEDERLLIRDAMTRLLEGDALYSDGKLTVKDLAKEARVKRWLLTHKHTDLRDEFYQRVRSQNATPTAMRELYEKISHLEEERAQDRDALRELRAEKELLARALAVLALEKEQIVEENAQLTERLGASLDQKVRSIRGGTRPAGR